MADWTETDILSVATTVGSREDARRLAQGLLEARLVACVQLDPEVESHYRWDGRLCAEPEVRLVLKTTPDRLQDIQAWLAEHHPYDLPQLVWQRLSATPAYAAWVRKETASAP